MPELRSLRRPTSSWNKGGPGLRGWPPPREEGEPDPLDPLVDPDASPFGAGLGAVARSLWTLAAPRHPPTWAEGVERPSELLRRGMSLQPIGWSGGLLRLRLGF